MNATQDTPKFQRIPRAYSFTDFAAAKTFATGRLMITRKFNRFLVGTRWEIEMALKTGTVIEIN